MSNDIQKDWWIFPGFKVEKKVSDLKLPVNLAFVPKPKSGKSTPLLYVTELYGQVKAISRDWKTHTFAKNLLNFKPSRKFPGTGESGVTGICVEPETGDVFVSLIYEDKEDRKNKIKNKLLRMKSKDGLKMDSTETIMEGIPSTTRAHQIQALSIGFDGKLYVNVGDGGSWREAPQNLKDLRGKILRMNLDGSIPKDNPYSSSCVYARGFRNPFGAAWRKKDKSLYVSINGPAVDDVIAKVKPKGNHGWYGDMRKNALFWWHFTQAPTALAFSDGNQFPKRYRDEMFVALFGNSYQEGRSVKGKKIVKMAINSDATAVKSYDEFVTYVGEGAASPCGLAFGPEGLYFTDLFGGHVFLVKPIEGYDFSIETEHVFA